LSAKLLEVRDLRIDIPMGNGTLHAVRGIDVDVNRGETLCIVGESGCGKSLTSLGIMGLLPRKARRTAKHIAFNGEDLAAADASRMNRIRGDRMSMVFQEPMTALNPCITIGEQLAEVLKFHRKAKSAEARDRAVFLLDRVGIPAAGQRLSQYPHQLSGGLRQRVMIAMALMCGPDLVIADEPTTALDVTIQAQILLLLRELQRELHMGLLLITHDLGIVARVADRVSVMYAGQIVESGTAAELFANPSHPYTRGLLACVPVPGRARGAPLGVIPGSVPSLVGDIRGCAFRERCDLAIGTCAEVSPAATELSPARTVRCLRAT
jgi:peptide/nickel transport system ATP-binding protein